MNPKKYKDFEKDIAEEVGVHSKVVSDFIDFFYAEVRKNLSGLTSTRVYIEGLGTFVIRKQKLEKTIKRNKDILGNLAKSTYHGYEKTVAVKEKIEQLEKINAEYEEILEDKRKFKKDKYSKDKL